MPAISLICSMVEFHHSRRIIPGCFSLWLFAPAFLWSQVFAAETGSDSGYIKTDPVIYAIEITGNRVTDARLILREMKLKPGMVASAKAIEADRLRIESLGLFNSVQIGFAEDAGRAVVHVRVSEPYYIYPYFVGRYKPAKPEQTVFGLGLYHYNLRGFGQKLNVAGWGGFARGFNISHEDPWYSIADKYGANGTVYYSDDEITDPLDQKVRRQLSGIRLSLQRRLGTRHHIAIGFDGEEIVSSSDYYTLTPGNRDRVATIRLEHKNDKRDYSYYPRRGYYIFLSGEASRVVDDHYNFYREFADLRGYWSIYGLTFALRGWGEFGQHTLPLYRWLSVDRSYVRAGEPFSHPSGSLLGGSIELRFDLIEPFYYSFEEVPLAGPYLMNLRFALGGVIFIDQGTYITSRSGFKDDFNAWGFGIQAQLPYIKTVHFLLGWTPSDELSNPSITIRNKVTF